MSLLGNLVSGARDAIEKKNAQARAAAEYKSWQQDAGWAFQFRVRYHLDFTPINRTPLDVYVVCNRNGDHLFTAEPGLLGSKRRTVIRNVNNEKIALLRVVRFKGLGVDEAVEVTIGDQSVGKVIKRKSGIRNGFDFGYYFEPLGLRLDYQSGSFISGYEIRNNMQQVVAVINRCKLLEEDTYRINFNDAGGGMIYLTMFLAMEDILDMR